MTKQKGFTLIELLVVIAIIGILSSIVLASLNSARNKGKDASATASMSSIRSSAEIYYNGTGGNSYGAAGDETGVCADADVLKLLTAATAQAGTSDCDVATAGAAYAASLDLLESGQHFCVDSTGVAKKSGTAKTDAATVCP